MTSNADFKVTKLLQMPLTYYMRSLRAICLRQLSSCLVPFLPVILIFACFCLKVNEESDLLFFIQTSVNCYNYARSLLK